MTTYVVPCGLSILAGIEENRGGPDPRVDSRGTAVNELRRRAADLHPVPGAGAEQWLDLCTRHTGPLRLMEWTAPMCAETDTLAARKDSADPRPESSDDSVVLLATDTPAGMLSAFLVASWLTGGNHDRVEYGQTPPAGDLARARPPRYHYPVGPGTVSVIRIIGLAARHNDGLLTGTYGLGDVLRHVRDTTDTAIEVHLSGGYKGTLLHTLSLAEILRSTARQRVSAWYRHEEDQSGQAAPIGLRRFSQGTLEDMAREVDIARNDPRELADNKDAVLAGVILTGSGIARPELNAFGYGYLALLPKQQPSDAEGIGRGR